MLSFDIRLCSNLFRFALRNACSSNFRIIRIYVCKLFQKKFTLYFFKIKFKSFQCPSSCFSKIPINPLTSHYHISSWIKFTFKFSQPSLEKLKNIYQFILFSPSSATHSILQRNKLINSTIFFSLNFWRHIISIASFVIKFTFKLS